MSLAHPATLITQVESSDRADLNLLLVGKDVAS